MLSRLQLESAGDAKYLLKSGTGYLLDKAGQPVMIDLSARSVLPEVFKDKAGSPVDLLANLADDNTAFLHGLQRIHAIAVSSPVDGARDVLIGEPDSPGVLEIVSRMIHSGTFPGNPRSMLCHEKYCPIYGTCKFRK
jgi:hypothetical protein